MSLILFRGRTRLAACSFLAFGLLATQSSAAQGLISTGTLIALEGDPAPDVAGTPLPGLTLGGDAGQEPAFLEPQIDETGVVVFRSRLYTASPNPIPLQNVSGDAIFYGTDRSNLRLALRGGEPVPGAQGAISADLPFGTSPFRESARLSSAGIVLVHSSLRDPQLSPPFDLVGSAWIGGQPGALNTFVRTGDAAPGTGGATFASFRPEWPSGSNSAGSFWFRASLETGTGVPSTGVGTNIGLWAGPPNALELVVRSGSLIPGTPGLFADEIELFPSVARAINDSGDLLFNTFLSRTLGANPATDTTDEVLCVHSPGSGSQIVAREGSPVPGLPGVTYRSFGLGQPQRHNFEVNERSLLRNGTVLFRAQLDGTASPPNDEWAVLRWDSGAVEIVTRSGEPAPGTAGTTTYPIDFLHNTDGQVALKQTYLEGGLLSQGIWRGLPGNLELVVREGQVMPGTGGGVLEALDSPLSDPDRHVPTFHWSDTGEVLFSCTLSGGTNPGRSLWIATERELIPVLLRGDTVTISPGDVRVVDDSSRPAPAIELGNGDGGSAAISSDGRIVLRVPFADSSSALMTVVLPRAFVSFCEGNGSGPGVCGNCPCANDAPAGSLGGCLNSAGRSSRLIGSGSPELADDTLRFEVSGASSNSFALLISADNRLPAMGPCPVGSGLLAFDGKRCTGGAFFRHGARATDRNGDIGTSNAGWGRMDAPAGGFIASSGFVLGQTRNFQAFYRDDPGLTCQTGQNSTNAVAVTFY